MSGDFLLTMSDHLFEASILDDLARLPSRDGVTLAVDYRIEAVFDLDDATKVQVEDGRIVAIDKRLTTYNAVDCGLFRCSPRVFDALAEAQAGGRMSLSDGMQGLGRRGLFHAMDIGTRWWQDVDTPEMAQEATARLAKFDARER